MIHPRFWFYGENKESVCLFLKLGRKFWWSAGSEEPLVWYYDPSINLRTQEFRIWFQIMPWVLFSLRTHFLSFNPRLIFLRPLPRKVTIHHDCSCHMPSHSLSLWVHQQHCYLKLLPYLPSNYYINRPFGLISKSILLTQTVNSFFFSPIIAGLLILHVKASFFKLKDILP